MCQGKLLAGVLMGLEGTEVEMKWVEKKMWGEEVGIAAVENSFKKFAVKGDKAMGNAYWRIQNKVKISGVFAH